VSSCYIQFLGHQKVSSVLEKNSVTWSSSSEDPGTSAVEQHIDDRPLRLDAAENLATAREEEDERKQIPTPML
jgi:hypothetical protein